MDQPQFRRNPQTGQVEEFRPVPVTRETLAAELEAEQEAQDQVDKTVAAIETQKEELEDRKTELEAQLSGVNNKLQDTIDTLKVALTEQEEQNERTAFRAAKLAAYDAVPTDDSNAVDEAPSADVEVAAGEPVPVSGQPTAEDVAKSLDLEPDPDEPEDDEEPEPAPSRIKAVPIRRRANI